MEGHNRRPVVVQQNDDGETVKVGPEVGMTVAEKTGGTLGCDSRHRHYHFRLLPFPSSHWSLQSKEDFPMFCCHWELRKTEGLGWITYVHISYTMLFLPCSLRQPEKYHMYIMN